MFGGAVGSTAHDTRTTHASNILLSVVGHSRGGLPPEREEEGRLKQLCSVFTLGGQPGEQLELKLVLGRGWDKEGQGTGAAGAACLRYG